MSESPKKGKRSRRQDLMAGKLTFADDEEKAHRIRVIAACLRAGRKPPTGMTQEEQKGALKLLEELDD